MERFTRSHRVDQFDTLRRPLAASALPLQLVLEDDDGGLGLFQPDLVFGFNQFHLVLDAVAVLLEFSN
jgi:hypothetical protein